MLNKSLYLRSSCIKIFVLLGLVSSCFHGDRLNEVDFSTLFHNGQSKLWMVSSKKIANTEYADSLTYKNDVLIFYKNGSILKTNFFDLYHAQGQFGKWSLDSKNAFLSIEFSSEKWMYNFQSTGRHKIKLKPLKESDNQYALVLESLSDF